MRPLLTQMAMEWRSQRRRPFVWICMLIYFTIAFGDVYQAGIAQDGYQWVNGADAIMTRAVILSVLGILAVAGIVGETIARDRLHRTEEIVLATGASRTALGLGRFIVAWLVCVVVGLMFIPGMLLGSLMPGIPSDKIGPTDLSHYAKAMAYFLLPNSLIVGALVFAVGSRYRSQAAAYLAGVSLLVIWVLTRMILGQDVLRHDIFPIYSLCEPFGTTASAQFAMEWTVAQNNERFVPLGGYLLWNRLIWISAAIIIILITIRWLPIQPATPRAAFRKYSWIRIPGGGFSNELFLITRWEFLCLLRQPGLRLLTILGALSIWFAATSSQTHQYSLPTTDLLVHSTAFYFDKILTVVLVWCAADTIWRDRQNRVDETIDAMPTSDTNKLLASTIAIIVIVLGFWLLAIGVNVLYQILQGFHNIELGLHFVDSFLFKAPPYIWMSILAIALQIVVRQRYVAMGIFLLIYFSSVLLDALGLYHPIYRFGEVSFFWYSLMDGYGHFWIAHLWLLAYWTLGSAILWILAWASLTRGTDPYSRCTILCKRLLQSKAKVLMAALLISFASVGGTIWYQSTILSTWPPPNVDQLKAEVEKSYGDVWRHKPQPRVVKISSEIDLFPSQRSFNLKGTYLLENQEAEPIRDLLILVEPQIELRAVSFSKPAALISCDEKLKIEHWKLETALPYNERIEMHFETGNSPSAGFSVHAKNDKIPEVSPVEILGNGTSLLNLQLMPAVGYTDRVEHKPRWKRRKYGLPQEWIAPSGDAGLRQSHETPHLGWVEQVDATITTDGDQIPVHAGKLLQDTITKDGRRLRRYRVSKPSRGWSAILSGRYNTKRISFDGQLPIEFYYIPEQTFTISRMATEFRNAVSYFHNCYGSPPFEIFQLAQQSLHFDGMGSRSGLGFATEILGWKSDLAQSNGKVIRKMAAHMMGMNWFGDQIIPANIAGAKVIHAGLPYWSAGLYLHQTNTRSISRQLRRQEMQEIFRARRSLNDEESPFIVEHKDSTMIRKKGLILMTYLAELVGPERIENAFRNFLDTWRYRNAPFPTVDDFIQKLRNELPKEFHPQLVDIFENITRWDLQSVKAEATQLDDYRWQVRATIEARKFYTSGTGNETEVEFATPVFVSLATDRGFSNVKTLAHRLITPRSGRSEIILECKKLPKYFALDVDLLLPDSNPNDQVIPIVIHKNYKR